MAEVGKWAKYSVTGLAAPTTTAATIDFTELTDANNIVTRKSAGVYEVDEAGVFAIDATGIFNDTSNGRHNPVWEITLNGVVVAGSPGSGYNRNSANKFAWTRAGAILDLAVTDEFSVRHYRDVDAPTGTYDQATFRVVKVAATGAALSHAGTPASAAYGGTVATRVTGWDVVSESDTAAVQISSNGVTLKNSRYYLFFASMVNSDAGGARTGRMLSTLFDSGAVEHAQGQAYQRDASNQYAFPNTWGLVKGDGTGQLLEFRVHAHTSPITPNWSDGSWVLSAAANAAGFMVVELDAGAAAAIYGDATGGQTISTSATLDLNVFRTTVSQDAPFSRVSNTAVDVSAATEVFGWAAVSVQRTVAATARLSNAGRFVVEAVAQADTEYGDYTRGDNWPDHWNCALGSTLVSSLALNDTINFEKFDPVTDDGSDDYSMTGGSFFVDLGSLVSVAAQDVAPGLAQSLATAYNPTVDVSQIIKRVTAVSGNSSSSSFSVNYSTTPINGNMMAVFMFTGAASITTPTGWTRQGGVTTTGDAALFRRLAGASEGTSQTFVVASATSTVWLYLEMSGVDETSPVRSFATFDVNGLETSDAVAMASSPKASDYSTPMFGRDAVSTSVSFTSGYSLLSVSTSLSPVVDLRVAEKWLDADGSTSTTMSWVDAAVSRALIVVWRVAETVAPDVAQTLTTAYDPVVATAAATIAPSLTQSFATAPGPTITTTVDVTPGPATSLTTANNPTITTGAVTVTPQLAQQLTTTSDPVVTTGAVTITPATAQTLATATDPVITTGAVTVTPGLTQNLTTATNPTITVSGVTITPGLASQAATAPNPAITTGVVTITPLTVTQLTAASDPVVTSTIDITPSATQTLITATNPTVTTTVDVTPGLAQNLVTASTPAISTDAVTITPGLATSLATVSNPAISTGTVDITPGLAQNLITTSNPTITVTSVTVTPNVAQNLTTAYDPTVLPGSVNIDPALAQQLTTTTNPVITATTNTDPGLAQQLITATNPTITTGPVSLYPGLTQQLATTYNPTISALTVTWTEGTTTVTTIGGASTTTTVAAGASTVTIGGSSQTTTIGGNMTTAHTEGTGKP